MSKSSNGEKTKVWRLASKRMSTRVEGQALIVEFVGGISKSWPLPTKDDKAAIREIREAAMCFAKEHGATHGQQNAIRKALTNAGYHLTK